MRKNRKKVKSLQLGKKTLVLQKFGQESAKFDYILYSGNYFKYYSETIGWRKLLSL